MPVLDNTRPLTGDSAKLHANAFERTGMRSSGLSQYWTREIVPGVHRLGTTYVGCYVVEDAGACTFIDTGLPGYWQHILGFLAVRNAPISAVKAVVLTHSHVDHVGNAERLRKEAGARVMVHEADLAMAMRTAGPPRWPMWKPRVLRYFLHALRSDAIRVIPVVEASTFVDEAVLDVPGRPRVIHTPGHTAGHSAISLEDRQILIVGDALATIDIPTGDVGPRLLPPYMNDNFQAALESLRKIQVVRASWVLPAHGMPWEGTPREAVDLARNVAGVSH